MALREFLDGLPSQFDKTVQGRVLLLDGDFLAYQAAATVKTLPTALRRFHTLIETERFLTGAAEVRVHLTARGCTKCNRYFYPTVIKYQDNRKSKPKPPLLEPLRMATQTFDWPEHIRVFLWHDMEADDALITDAYYYKENSVMSSGDKDLCLTPYPLWLSSQGKLDIIEDRFGWIDIKPTANGNKVFGHGTKFFWAQMIMGDAADNVRGLVKLNGKGCGPVAAHTFINEWDDEQKCAEAVLWAYARTQQNPLAEAECLWLHRSPMDSAYAYFKELNLTPDLDKWIDSLHDYNQQYLQYQFQMRDETNGTFTAQDDAGSQETGNDDSPPWD